VDRNNSANWYEKTRMSPAVFNEEHLEAAVQRASELRDKFHTNLVMDQTWKDEEDRAILQAAANEKKRRGRPSMFRPEHLKPPERQDIVVHRCFLESHTRPRGWDWKSKVCGELGAFCAAHAHYWRWFLTSDDGSIRLSISHPPHHDFYVFCRSVTSVSFLSIWPVMAGACMRQMTPREIKQTKWTRAERNE